MATLTNPIEETNLAARFADYVAATANNSIVWGTNAYPTSGSDVITSTVFGGTTSGRSPGLSAADIKNGSEVISAANITAALRAETAAYMSIRNLRARLNVTGAGGNTGTRPTAGITFDQTNKAYLDSDRLITLGAVTGAPVAGTSVTVTGLQSYFVNLRTAYTTARDTTVTITRNVCHSSCHNSCHSSRGRR